jgi:hypothetical protein
MTAFHIHDEEGRITQSNKVYDAEGYDKVLHEHGMTFVQENSPHHASIDREFIHKGRREACPKMPVRVNKTALRVGEGDAVKIRGIPKDARITVTARGVPQPLWDAPLPDGWADLSVPAPGAYLVSITKHPYREWRQVVSATA